MVRLRALCSFDSKLWTGDSAGNIWYTSSGAIWTLATTLADSADVCALYSYGDFLWISSSSGSVYHSDDGITFVLSSDLGTLTIEKFYDFENKLWAVDSVGQIWHTKDLGDNWKLNSDLGTQTIFALTEFNSALWTGDDSGKVYYSSDSVGQSFTNSISQDISFSDDISEIENVISVPYGPYKEDTTKLLDSRDDTSIDTYGSYSRSSLSFTYEDIVSIHADDISAYETSLDQLLNRMKGEVELVTISVPLQILRTSIFDIIGITNTKLNFQNKKFWVLEVSKNFDTFSGEITGVIYAD
ncbi:MAG: hypothetical protein ABIH18_04955 [Candidatus Omnitrophota bacterium]